MFRASSKIIFENAAELPWPPVPQTLCFAWIMQTVLIAVSVSDMHTRWSSAGHVVVVSLLFDKLGQGFGASIASQAPRQI
jgi:hypothetical protein